MALVTGAAAVWRDALGSWAIPDEIREQATEDPWIHPVELFTATGDTPPSPSHDRAREALPEGGSVLDIGSGGGRASMALADRAGLVVGVDRHPAMLEAYAEAAHRHHVAHREILGDWPSVSSDSPTCDVVVAHHIVYNVPDLGVFLRACHLHARRRVVLELPARHPLSHMAPLWEHFWGLRRPDRPTADDFLEVCREMGMDIRSEAWDEEGRDVRARIPLADQVRFNRIRLCLPPDREPEVEQAMALLMPPGPRRMVTVWWDPR
jgi:SAM-dependent methyltransferase